MTHAAFRVFAMVLVCMGLPAAGLSYEKRLDCGSASASTGPGGKVYEADVAYDGTNGAGYVGGTAHDVSFPTSRSRDNGSPYGNTRDGAFEYRFDLPNGEYLVTLGFVDHCLAWAADPCDNVGDVVVENVPLVTALKVRTEAQGYWKVLEYRLPVTVTDGQLNVALTATSGGLQLGAIEVVDRPVVPGAPAPPLGVRAQDGYGRVDVLWNNNGEADLAGYHVYRAIDANGPWQRVDNRRENLQSVFNDFSAADPHPWTYRVTAVDVDGNESAPSSVATATSHSAAETTLPLITVDMSEEDLAQLDRTYFNDIEYPAQIAYPGLLATPGTARYRGNIARWFTKHGWKVKPQAVLPDWGGDTLNLNSDMWDAFMVRKCLSFDLYRSQGVSALQCRETHLEVNGEYYGVVHQFENSDKYLLQRLGLDPSATELFKDDGGGLFAYANPAQYRSYYEQETGTGDGYALLQEFIEAINTAQEDMNNTIAEYVDLPNFVKYYATMNFLSEWDSCVHNYDIYRDPATGLWRFIPLDHDGSWGNQPWNPWSAASDAGVNICTSNQQAVGWNKLYDLYVRNMQLRKRHDQYLRKMMGTAGAPFSLEALGPQIDAAVARVTVDAARDANKFPWEDNGPLGAASSTLRGYVTARWTQTQATLASSTNPLKEPDDEFNVYVNEFMSKNTGSVHDEYGEANNWVELYNAAEHAVPLNGVYLSDDLNTPRKWAFPVGTTIPAQGFLVVWFDNQPAQGSLHAPLTLKGDNGAILLSSRGGLEIQKVKYGAQLNDISQGMLQDGYYRWRRYLVPSPGATNANGTVNQPAKVTGTRHAPAYPSATDPVTITATITDDGTIQSATLYYQYYIGTGAIWTNTPLVDDGAHGDGAAGDHVYGAQIAAQNKPGKTVKYYVVVSDNVAVQTKDPSRAPDRTYRYVIAGGAPAVRINEFMADNTHTIADERGEYEDWVELHNTSAAVLDVSGMYLSDDAAQPRKWRFADGQTIPAGGYLLVWADSDPEQGVLHATFKLSKSGEALYLSDRDETGNVPVDARVFGPQVSDWSEGRWTENSNDWVKFYNATPGAVNQEPDGPPTIAATTQLPAAPTQADDVTITAAIADDHALARQELFVDTGAGFAPVALLDDGLHGDGAAGDGVFGALIAHQPLGATVRYYVEAADAPHGNVTRDPANAPGGFYSYVIGYLAPTVVINEFLADNKHTLTDEYGQYDDWIELYNSGNAPVDLGGMYLTDDLTNTGKWQIPAPTVLAPHEYLVFWADSTPAQGRMHTSFALSKGGEQVGLYDTDANGRHEIDAYSFGAQTTDVSTGRMPDAGPAWQTFTAPTPSGPNSGLAPVTGLAASPYNTIVDLAWAEYADPLTASYEVLGGNTAAGPFAVLGTVPAGGWLRFRDTGLANGVMRYYKVRALLSDGRRTKDSAMVAATPAAGATAPVTDLRVVLEGDDVVLRWTPTTNQPALDHVDVFRDDRVLLDADVDAGVHLYGTAGAAVSSFADVGERTSGVMRFYQVRPVDGAGQRATE